VEKITSRKLALTLILTVLFSFLLTNGYDSGLTEIDSYKPYIDQNIFNSLMIFLWGGYVAGNGIEHFKPK